MSDHDTDSPPDTLARWVAAGYSREQMLAAVEGWRDYAARMKSLGLPYLGMPEPGEPAPLTWQQFEDRTDTKAEFDRVVDDGLRGAGDGDLPG